MSLYYLEVYKGVLAVIATEESKSLLADTFLRFQEYYESVNPKFKGHIINKEEYSKWHVEKFGGEYQDMWGGFNVPAYVFRPNKAYKVGGITRQPIRLSFEENRLVNEVFDKQYKYVIGFTAGDLETFYHELAHAFYYLNNEYRFQANLAISQHLSEIFPILDALKESGYSEDVLFDEVQAYCIACFESYYNKEKGVVFPEELKGKIQDIYYRTLHK